MDSSITMPESGQSSVFIIGGMTGVGRELARALVKAGYCVSATCSTSKEAAALRADGVLPAYPDIHHAGELRSAMKGCEARLLVNLAPQASNVPPQLNAPLNDELDAHTRTIVEAAAGAGIAFYIHTSYAFLDGQVREADPDDVLEPISDVLAAARAAETVALSGAIPACVLRLGYLYGADIDALVKLSPALKGAWAVPAGESRARAAWLHQSDAARALALAIARQPAGQTLTVSDGHPATPAEFMTYFASAQGLGLGGIALPLLSHSIKPTHQALMKLDMPEGTPSAVEALGWSPRYVDFRQGIDEVLLSWRAQMKLAQPEV